MIVKPSIQFINNDSDPVLITDTGSIITALTGNAHFTTPAPTLAAMQTALTEFSTAVNDAVNGGVVLTAIKNTKRAVLAVLLRQLAAYVQVKCNGDMTILLTSGFPIQKPSRTPIGVLPAPTILAVTFGPRSGELAAQAQPMNGAAIFNWRVTADGAPTVVVQAAQTTAASVAFTGLTPGVVYNISANVVGSAGQSDWSDVATQMAV
ncbi:MAG: hypothetical protein RLZZ350_2480 [Verrucomicrobiota bacterium]|jgi:hypothetical protein